MELLKVLVLGVIISILSVLFKQIKPEYSLFTIIAGGIILIIYIINGVSDIFGYFGMIVSKTGIDNNYFSLVLKIIGVGYLIEFASGICEDSGNKSIADKIVIAGKILIFSLSLPIISSLFNLVVELI